MLKYHLYCYFLSYGGIRLKKASLADNAANQIRELIFSGDLKPGEHANIDVLAKRFAISQTPVREALKKLISEGLVVYEPKVGYAVRNLTLHEYLQVSEIHQIIEVYLVRELAKNKTLVDFDALEKINEKIQEAIAQNDIVRIGEGNDLFHRKLYEKYPNKLLLSRLHELWNEVLSLRNIMYKSAVFTSRIFDEHQKIIETIRAGDEEGAAHAMNAHYFSAKEGAIAAFPVVEK